MSICKKYCLRLVISGGIEAIAALDQKVLVERRREFLFAIAPRFIDPELLCKHESLKDDEVLAVIIESDDRRRLNKLVGLSLRSFEATWEKSFSLSALIYRAAEGDAGRDSRHFFISGALAKPEVDSPEVIIEESKDHVMILDFELEDSLEEALASQGLSLTRMIRDRDVIDHLEVVPQLRSGEFLTVASYENFQGDIVHQYVILKSRPNRSVVSPESQILDPRNLETFGDHELHQLDMASNSHTRPGVLRHLAKFLGWCK